jgi:hypothetical protein
MRHRRLGSASSMPIRRQKRLSAAIAAAHFGIETN